MSAEKDPHASPAKPDPKPGAEPVAHKLSGIWTESVDSLSDDMMASRQTSLSPALKALLNGGPENLRAPTESPSAGPANGPPEVVDPADLDTEPPSNPASAFDDLPAGGSFGGAGAGADIDDNIELTVADDDEVRGSGLQVEPDDQVFSLLDEPESGPAPTMILGGGLAKGATSGLPPAFPQALETEDGDDGRSALDDSLIISPSMPLSAGSQNVQLSKVFAEFQVPPEGTPEGWNITRGGVHEVSPESPFEGQSVLSDESTAGRSADGAPESFVRMMMNLADNSSVNQEASSLFPTGDLPTAAGSGDSATFLPPDALPAVPASAALPFPGVDLPPPPAPPAAKLPELKLPDYPKSKPPKPAEPLGVQRISGIWTASVDVLAGDLVPAEQPLGMGSDEPTSESSLFASNGLDEQAFGTSADDVTFAQPPGPVAQSPVIPSPVVPSPGYSNSAYPNPAYPYPVVPSAGSGIGKPAGSGIGAPSPISGSGAPPPFSVGTPYSAAPAAPTPAPVPAKDHEGDAGMPAIAGIWTPSIDGYEEPSEAPPPPRPLSAMFPSAAPPAPAASSGEEGLWKKTNVDDSPAPAVSGPAIDPSPSTAMHKISGIWTNSIDSIAADMVREPIVPRSPVRDVFDPVPDMFSAVPSPTDDVLTDDEIVAQAAADTVPAEAEPAPLPPPVAAPKPAQAATPPLAGKAATPGKPAQAATPPLAGKPLAGKGKAPAVPSVPVSAASPAPERIGSENIFSEDAAPGMVSGDSLDFIARGLGMSNAPLSGPPAPVRPNPAAGRVAPVRSGPAGLPPTAPGNPSGSFSLSGDSLPLVGTQSTPSGTDLAGQLFTPSMEARSSRGSFEGITGSGSYEERGAPPVVPTSSVPPVFAATQSGAGSEAPDPKKTKQTGTKSGSEPETAGSARTSASAPTSSTAAPTVGSAAARRTDVAGARGFIDQSTKVVVKLRTVSNPDQPIASPLPPDYELLEKLGEGGMGVVYLARQSSIDRQIALKMLQPQRATEPKVRARFLAEATATGDLDHPNIVPIYDLGCTATGALFYSMKRVRGIPWADVFAKKTIEENIEILLRMADAVAFAHSRGIIHRDLKPENVMLGDFGEVLVMDWGLAVSIWKQGKAVHIEHSQAVAGSPSYMAPEMAGNKAYKLGFQSDIYLLGATLFELLTGRPPHAGKTLKDCLGAAQRNDIVTKIQYKTEYEELMQLARRAMGTDPKDRYPTVQDFQLAVRGYMGHAESITLSQKAEQHLRHGQNSRSYDAFAQAIFGFREALAQWSGNREAETGLQDAMIQYALTAQEKGDFDLAASLLDRENPNHRKLLSDIQKDIHERQRKQKLAWVATLAAVVFAVCFVAALIISNIAIYGEQQKTAVALKGEQRERGKAEAAEKDAVTARDAAEKQRELAEINERKAKEQEQEANRQKQAAIASQKKAEEAAALEKLAKDKEVEARKQEQLALEAAVKAQNAEKEERKIAEYQAYVARIGLASSKIEVNSIDRAAELLALEARPGSPRNWEWGRLEYLCRLAVQSYRHDDQRLDAAVLSQDGSRVVTAGWDGAARIWDARSARAIREFRHGLYVHAAALSPDGTRIATGSNEPNIIVWDTETGKPLHTLKGHDGAVFALEFSKDGSRLVSGSADGTARVWTWNEPDTQPLIYIENNLGHRGPIRHLDLSADGRMLATAGDDGLVIVWSLIERQQYVLAGHEGPVGGVSFSPDGKRLLSAGSDQRAILWQSDASASRPDGAWKISRSVPLGTPLRAAAYSPDGRNLAVGGNDNTIHLLDADGRPQQTLRGHAGWISSIAWDRNGGRLLSAAFDGQAKLWEPSTYAEQFRYRAPTENQFLSAAGPAETGETLGGGGAGTAVVWSKSGEVATILDEGHRLQILDVDFAADGSWLVSGSLDGTARIWNAATGIQRTLIAVPGTAVHAVAGTPDSKFVVLAANGRTFGAGGRTVPFSTLRVCRVEDGRAIASAVEEDAEVHSISVAPSGAEFLVGFKSGKVQRWAIAGLRKLKEYKQHNGAVVSVRYLEDGRTGVSAATDKTVSLWTLPPLDRAGEDLFDARTLAHDTAAITDMVVDPQANLVITSVGEFVQVWNPQSRQVVRKMGHTRSVVGMARSRTAPLVAAVTGDDMIHLWNYETGEQVAELTGRPGATRAIAFSGDGKRLYASDGAVLRVWNWETATDIDQLRRHEAISGIVWRNKGTQAITAGTDDRQIKLWDRETGLVLRRFVLDGHAKRVNGLALSPDQKTLASFGDDDARLWDIDSGKLLQIFGLHQEPVRGAAFSPDGTRLVTCSEDRTARIWETATGKPGPVLTGHGWWVLSAAFSPDGGTIVTAGGDSIVRRWNAETGAEEPWLDREAKPTRRLRGHTGEINSVAFSPDGKRLLTAGDDTTAKIWDVKEGQEVLTITGHRREISQTFFSRDGLKVITAGLDGEVVLWPSLPWEQAAGVGMLRTDATAPE